MLRATALILALASPAAAEIRTVQSLKSVPDTMDALEAAVEEAGATVFARVDHTAGAEAVDMDLSPSQLLIFGNPRLGTPAMQADIQTGLVLPLRVLVYEGDQGDVQVAYERVSDMFDGFGVDVTADYVAQMESALRMLADRAVE
ncbi:DUF302 domain-containing protein [Loktanella sp. SALINAS62]|uniref:DUF302 domain-containing protein n=1 Tax=Loktanella sp. SALINAS62 TaxID=2706124 RepID=UPI001B8D2560|nr:DUF302 domain-containing protein [Loktanella sp. SALINAS62]MBS1303845.1 DUF302 domain-containing protein [Loktanella sp. SALINAS62]